MDIITEAHSRSVEIRGRHVDSPQCAPFLKDLRNKRFARYASTILDEPLNRQTGNMDSIRSFAGFQLVHVFRIPEIGVPAVSGWEVILRLGRADLEDVGEAGQIQVLRVQPG